MNVHLENSYEMIAGFFSRAFSVRIGKGEYKISSSELKRLKDAMYNPQYGSRVQRSRPAIAENLKVEISSMGSKSVIKLTVAADMQTGGPKIISPKEYADDRPMNEFLKRALKH